jgi:hypothetical protein
MDQILNVIQEMVGNELHLVSYYMLCLCEMYLVIGGHHFQQLLLHEVRTFSSFSVSICGRQYTSIVVFDL